MHKLPANILQLFKQEVGGGGGEGGVRFPERMSF